MRRTWRFLQGKRNREILAWLGGGAVVLAGGLWTAATFFWPQDKPSPGKPSTNVEASHGSTAVGGNVTGSTITSTVTDGRAPPAAPPDRPK